MALELPRDACNPHKEDAAYERFSTHPWTHTHTLRAGPHELELPCSSSSGSGGASSSAPRSRSPNRGALRAARSRLARRTTTSCAESAAGSLLGGPTDGPTRFVARQKATPSHQPCLGHHTLRRSFTYLSALALVFCHACFGVPKSNALCRERAVLI